MKTKEAFVEELQKIMNENGIKCSKETAWKVYKGMVGNIVAMVTADEDNKISLAGIGNYELIKSTPRGTKEGVVEFVPRLRWRPSSKINTLLEELTGQVPDPEKVAAKRAELEKAGKLHNNLPPREKKDTPTEPAAAAVEAKNKKADAAKTDAKSTDAGAKTDNDEFGDEF